MVTQYLTFKDQLNLKKISKKKKEDQLTAMKKIGSQ